MSNKLLWTGLTMIVALPLIFSIPALTVAGAVIMLIGCILMWLDR